MTLREIVELASQLADEMGEDGHEVIAARSREHQAKGDAEAAALWGKVALAMKTLGHERSPPSLPPRPARPNSQASSF